MLSQTTSDAVIVSLRRPLSWANTVTWPVRLTARLVRIEGVRAVRATCRRSWCRYVIRETRLIASIAGAAGLSSAQIQRKFSTGGLAYSGDVYSGVMERGALPCVIAAGLAWRCGRGGAGGAAVQMERIAPPSTGIIAPVM
jgi:hypothetical protein